MGLRRAGRPVLRALALAGMSVGTALTPAGAGPGTVQAPVQAIGSVPNLAQDGWVKVLEDNFDGTTLDTSVWEVANRTNGSIVTSPEAVSVGGGNLTLTNFTRGSQWFQGGISSAHNEAPFDAGFLSTYGYLEARINFDWQPGSHGGFWTYSQTLSTHGNNPLGDTGASSPEVDVIEHGRRVNDDLDGDGKCDNSGFARPCHEVYMAGTHWDGYEEEHKNSIKWVENQGTTSLLGEYHIYSMLWTPDGYRIYQDGVEVWSGTDALSYSPQFIFLTSYVDLNQGPGSFGDVDTSTNKMKIDYVRLWQRPISEVADVTVPASSPVAMPFTVTDHSASGSSTKVRAQPGAVQVTATSSNQAVVADGDIRVAGNPPGDPDGSGPLSVIDGSFDNGGFENGATGWTLTDTPPADSARLWTTKAHGGSTSLRLETAGGRATQTITGLRPATTYQVGIWDNFDNDGDNAGTYEWGIEDVDTDRAGPQKVSSLRRWPVWNTWAHDMATFTTGPGTTSVVLFASNQNQGGNNDSNVSIDDLWVKPIVPPNRTVTLRPASDQTGASTITLEARDAAGGLLGTEAFTVTFQRGSTFTNGDFESAFTTGGFDLAPNRTGWELHDGDLARGRGAEIVSDDPFGANRVLKLAAPAPDPAVGTAFQEVAGLVPGASYKLQVRGKVATSTQDGMYFAVWGHAGTNPCAVTSNCQIITTAWSTKEITFTAAAAGTATVVLRDWGGADGSSFVDDVRLTPVATTGANAFTYPSLTSLGEQRMASTAPRLIPFREPYAANAQLPGGTIDYVTSNNQDLLPDAGVAVVGRHDPAAVDNWVLSVTPVPDRTGKATLTIGYTLPGNSSDTVEIPVIVTDEALVNPAFERSSYGWDLQGNTVVATDGRNGSAGLRLANANGVKQTIARRPHHTNYVLNGWVQGAVRVEVRKGTIAAQELPEVLATADWTGSGWTERSLQFTTKSCVNCKPWDQRPVEIVVRDLDPADGVSTVDDLTLMYAPIGSGFEEISFFRGQTGTTTKPFSTGRLPANSFWDPTAVSVTSSNTAAVPTPALSMTDSMRNTQWRLAVGAGATPGISNVDVKLTDPVTGAATTQHMRVTVNAGNNFDNGDFQRGDAGWTPGWLDNDYGFQQKQQWQYLGYKWSYLPASFEPVPYDLDKVLRIKRGAVQAHVTGLTPNTTYVLRWSAIGSGSEMRLQRTAGLFGEQLPVTPVAVNSLGGWTGHTMTFTTTPAPATGYDGTHVWLYVNDTTAAAGDTGNRPCVLYSTQQTGESCYDDISLLLQ